MLYCHDIIIINISITKINIAELSTFIFIAFKILFIFSKAKNIIKYVLKNPEICLCSLSKSLFSIKSNNALTSDDTIGYINNFSYLLAYLIIFPFASK